VNELVRVDLSGRIGVQAGEQLSHGGSSRFAMLGRKEMLRTRLGIGLGRKASLRLLAVAAAHRGVHRNRKVVPSSLLFLRPCVSSARTCQGQVIAFR
jgi:hypothetical protein